MVTEKWKVDIIVPTYRPDETFLQLLSQLEVQTVPINKVIIVNTEEKYWVEPKTSLNLEVTHIPKKGFDHGGVRHLGALLSSADYILYMTQDAVPGNELVVENLLRAFTSKEIIAAYARQIPKINADILEVYTRKYNYPETSMVKGINDVSTMGIKTYFCSNVCAMYRRDDYLELGGFIRKTIFNEDMIFAANAINAGRKIAYAAEAIIIHSHNYTNKDQFKRNFDLAVSQKDHPEIFATMKSESEGIKMIMKTIQYLFSIGKPWYIPALIVKSGYKYFGYRMGLRYETLSEKKIRNYTMNPSYWDGYFLEKEK